MQILRVIEAYCWTKNQRQTIAPSSSEFRTNFILHLRVALGSVHTWAMFPTCVLSFWVILSLNIFADPKQFKCDSLAFIYGWIQRWSKEIFWNGDSSPTLNSFLLTGSVTRFAEISPLWCCVIKLWPFWTGSFTIWHNVEANLANFIWFWANVQCCKWPNIEPIDSPSGHTGPYPLKDILSKILSYADLVNSDWLCQNFQPNRVLKTCVG